MTDDILAARSDFTVQRATLADVPVLATQRIAMYLDMGELPAENAPALLAAAAEFFRDGISRGDYVAWLATPRNAPNEFVGGAGMLVRRMLPRPSATGISHGFDGQISSVYVAPAWRRKGLARLLMQHVLDYARAHGIERLNLHASADGRPLYEKMGFAATNEMRLIQPSEAPNPMMELQRVVTPS